MRKKYLITGLAVIIGALVTTIIYYDIDWNELTNLSFYQNLANPSVRIVYVPEGLRKEEIADIMASKLNWNEFDKTAFVNAHIALGTTNREGRYFPKTYMLKKDEGPTSVSTTMFHEFTAQTSKIKKPKSTKIINQDTVLKIASIIQREAAGKHDMKLISGIIWNRIWSDMRLQIDATVQYAIGNEENGWWEQIDPKDKKINSPYNTYLHKDLPPYPIANPGLAAVDAAWNPQKTSCIFYLHDKNGRIHCTKTYADHKKNIEKYY